MTFFTNKNPRDTTEPYNSCKQKLIILAGFWLFFSSVKNSGIFVSKKRHALGWRWQQQEMCDFFFPKRNSSRWVKRTTCVLWIRSQGSLHCFHNSHGLGQDTFFLKLTVLRLQFDLRRTLPNGRLLLVQLDSIVFDVL